MTSEENVTKNSTKPEICFHIEGDIEVYASESAAVQALNNV